MPDELYPEYALQWPPELELIELPKRVRWVGVRAGESMPTDEEVDRLFDILDPESKALRAWEGE